MWQVLSIFLQASGILLVLWITLGVLVLGAERGGVCVRFCRKGDTDRTEAFVRSCSWLREMGILRMPVLLVDRELPYGERLWLEKYISYRTNVFLCSEAELMQILEKEAEVHGRAGSAAWDCSGDCL